MKKTAKQPKQETLVEPVVAPVLSLAEQMRAKAKSIEDAEREQAAKRREAAEIEFQQYCEKLRQRFPDIIKQIVNQMQEDVYNKRSCTRWPINWDTREGRFWLQILTEELAKPEYKLRVVPNSEYITDSEGFVRPYTDYWVDIKWDAGN